MKNNKRNHLKLGLLFLFVLTLGIWGNSNTAFAASKAAKAKTAYKTFLSNIYNQKDFKSYKDLGTNYGELFFLVKDISGDKIPELIVKATYTEPKIYYIYTYRNGKVKKLTETSYYDGGELMYIYPSKHYIMTMEGDSWEAGYNYYRVYNSKIKLVAKESGGNYYLNGKKVSQSKYNNYIKKIKKSKRYSVERGSYQFRKNTKSNRKKYIK